MDRVWLETQLAAGRSIESLARDAGRHPSTIAYWVNKHGLVSPHASRHAPRGAIPREVLVELVEEGLALRGMAERLGVSYSTVRHWMRRHELATPRARRLAENAASVVDGAAPASPVLRECATHGITVHILTSNARGYRCRRCRADAVSARRRRVKAALVAEAGGACCICGYDRYVGALQFHHVDPGTKSFSIADRGLARSIARARAEAQKCLLVCANCHAEIEGGIATIPESAPPAE